MNYFILNSEIREETLVSCYFFHGEETFPAYQFIKELKKALISTEDEDYNAERFNLEDKSWAEVIDLARTVPFLISPWRIIIVEIPKGNKESLSSQEQGILKDYFASPPSKTVIVIIFSGKIRKSSSLFKFFSSLPSSIIRLKEIKSLKERALYTWMDKKFQSQGKTATPDAIRRLEELVGNDLRRVDNEIEKLVTFIGEKKVVELDDVNQASGWIKTFIEWELTESLVKADYGQCLRVVDNLLKKEGVKPVNVLGIMAGFFRDILLAKLLLKERDVDKKAIFREIKPQIHEKFGKFYTDKFREFFTLVERISMKDLNRFLYDLEEIDLKIKSSDISPQVLLERYLFDYCDLRKKVKITWKEKN